MFFFFFLLRCEWISMGLNANADQQQYRGLGQMMRTGPVPMANFPTNSWLFAARNPLPKLK